MKIVGNMEDINTITFIHKGKNAKFQCILHPKLPMSNMDIEQDKKAEIVFYDLREVEELIAMLERFKTECLGYIGSWYR